MSATKSSTELRADVVAARERLASTVGELGGVVDETRTQITRKVRTVAPIAAGVLGALVVLRLLRRR